MLWAKAYETKVTLVGKYPKFEVKNKMAKKNDKKDEKKPVIKTARCNLCRGTGKTKPPGLGWSYETCSYCRGRGSYEYEVKKRCFVATAVYGSEMSPEVILLRQYRDEILLQTSLGNLFINFYYFISPPIALWIKDKLLLKRTVRKGLDFFVNTVVSKSLRKEKQ